MDGRDESGNKCCGNGYGVYDASVDDVEVFKKFVLIKFDECSSFHFFRRCE
jgi:hypothetical protein